MKGQKASSLENVRTISNAVIGIVDIVSSSQLSNQLGVEREWNLKAQFFLTANELAQKFGVVIINHTGDGFLFLLEPERYANWAQRLMKFHYHLTENFKKIMHQMASSMGDIKSGLRFGVSAGPLRVGLFQSNDLSLHAVGPDINLAARMCASAEIGEMVLSSRVYRRTRYSLFRYREEQISRIETCKSPKGFEFDIDTLHLQYANEVLEAAFTVLKRDTVSIRDTADRRKRKNPTKEPSSLLSHFDSLPRRDTIHERPKSISRSRQEL